MGVFFDSQCTKGRGLFDREQDYNLLKKSLINFVEYVGRLGLGTRNSQLNSEDLVPDPGVFIIFNGM